MEINILEGNKHINLSLKQWLLAVHIWYMLEGKYQRNGDTKKQKTTINYSMTTTFQLIRGEQMFIFCLLLLSQKAPPPAVWRQRKKWIMQDFSEWTIQIIQLLLKVYFMFYIQNRGKKSIDCILKEFFLHSVDILSFKNWRKVNLTWKCIQICTQNEHFSHLFQVYQRSASDGLAWLRSNKSFWTWIAQKGLDRKIH